MLTSAHIMCFLFSPPVAYDEAILLYIYHDEAIIIKRKKRKKTEGYLMFIDVIEQEFYKWFILQRKKIFMPVREMFV